MIIDLKRQELVFQGRTYPVSTAKNGPGEKNGSLCTPRGSHIAIRGATGS
jgi:L,D-transpeptidase YbiS